MKQPKRSDLDRDNSHFGMRSRLPQSRCSAALFGAGWSNLRLLVGAWQSAVVLCLPPRGNACNHQPLSSRRVYHWPPRRLGLMPHHWQAAGTTWLPGSLLDAGRPKRTETDRRGGRVAECTALEMRHTCKGIEGSNPSLSAILSLKLLRY